MLTIQQLFANIATLSPEPVTICYYICAVDHIWIPRPNGEIQLNNLGSAARTKGKEIGYFNGSAPPKLGDFYGATVMPLEFQPHLSAHTALSDALMLYTLLQLGIIA